MTFWLNGAWRNDKDAIAIDDRGLLLGDGVFETLLVRNAAPAFLSAHLTRFTRSLSLLGIEAAPPDNLRALIGELAARNGYRDKDAALRITATRGPGGRGLAPVGATGPATLLMTMADAPPRPTGAVTLHRSPWVRSSKSVAARCKSLGYLDNLLARRDAERADADDALMFNEDGRVACASAANVFVIDGRGAAATPALGDGALAGTVRGLLLDAGASLGVECVEKTLGEADLEAGAVFVTNSLIGLAPARFGASPDTMRNPLFKRLATWYEDALDDDLRRAAQ